MSANSINNQNNVIGGLAVWASTGKKPELKQEFILATVEETIDYPTTNGIESEEAGRQLVAVIDRDGDVTFKMESGRFIGEVDEDGNASKEFVVEDTDTLYEVNKQDFDIDALKALLTAIEGK